MGIEPTSEGWEARNKNLKTLELAASSPSNPSATLYFTYLTVAENTSSMARPVRQPELGASWSRLSVQMGCETPP